MGNQIVKQPNGNYAIWSSVVDDFIVIDCDDAGEIVQVFVESFRRDTEVRVGQILEELSRGGKPYHQLTNSFGECVEVIRDLHGDDADSLKMLGISKERDDAINDRK